MKTLFAAFLTLCCLSTAFAQDKPYFQQEVNYVIRVRLDDQKHFLHASEEIEYKNNSPETLDKIYFHLWPNAFSTEKSAWGQQMLGNNSSKFHFAKKEKRGYIDSLDFKVNGEKATLTPDPKNPDIAELTLPKPLAPGQSCKITTPFRVKIPHSFSRLGHIGQQYQITQWYPKPAVYDRKGWHAMPYLDQGEFFSEFGKFDVYIEVPKNYVVGATGNLMNNPEEEKWLAEREKKSREMAEAETQKTNKVFTEEFEPTAMKTLHFQQDRIHDFAFFADKQYYVLTDSVKLPRSGRVVKTVAMFNERDKKNWKKGAQYVGEGVYYYSLWVGEYPYNVCTAVDGALSAGSGMEYPTITVVSGGSTPDALREVIVHEVGHNWFYGILASNERIHPWQDEGCNSYIEYRTMDTLHALEPDVKTGSMVKNYLGVNLPIKGLESQTKVANFAHSYVQGANRVQPLDYPAADYWMINYGVIVYMKSVTALRYFEQYLGREMMDKCFQNYFNEWKFKHPYPEDMKVSFEKTSGQKLGWFFDEFLKSDTPVDFVLKDVEQVGDSLIVTVDNRSDFALSAPIFIENDEKKVIAKAFSVPVRGVSTTKIALPAGTNWKVAEVNSNQILPERHIHNNTISNCKAFKSWSSPAFRFIANLNDPMRKRALTFLPTIGFNSTDGFMLGGLFYYQFMPKRHFEFHAMPMYAFGSKLPVGSAGLTARFYPKSVFRKIEFHSRAAFFANLLRFQNRAEFYFKNKSGRSKVHHQITLRTHQLADYRPNYSNEKMQLRNDFLPYYTALDWEFSNDKTFYDYGFKTEIGFHSKDAIRMSATAFATYKFTKRSYVYLRGFVGGFAANKGINHPWGMPHPLDWGLSGSGDPFGQSIMFDRAGKSQWLPQLINDHGGFRSPTGVGSSTFLATANMVVKTPLPIIQFFGDIGTAKVVQVLPWDGVEYKYKFFYDAGFSLDPFGGFLRFNFPVVGSCYADGYPANAKDFAQKINFTLQIDHLLRKMNL